jgi:hypothetical protein
VLRTADGQTLRWPKRLLKPDLAVGDPVHILVLADTDALTERERLAKLVLTEMLNGA